MGLFGSMKQYREANKNIRKLKPLIADRKQEVAQKQFEAGRSQPITLGQSSTLYADHKYRTPRAK